MIQIITTSNERSCMNWYRLSTPQWGILIVFIVLSDVFTITQKYVVPEFLRPLAYVLFVILILLVFFFIVRPEDPVLLAKTLAIILGVITFVLILIQDVILAFNLSWKTIVILLGAVLAPFIAGYLYRVHQTGHRSG